MTVTWEQRVEWGRKNYQRGYDLDWKMNKYLALAANLTALAAELEEEAQTQLVTPRQEQAWKELYNGWTIGPTE